MKLLIALALLSELVYLSIVLLGDLRPHIPIYLVCYGVLFTLYAVGAGAIFLRQGPQPAQSQVLDRESEASFRKPHQLSDLVKRLRDLSGHHVLLVGGACSVLFNITLLFGPPTLSDDIYRYVWDGRVAAAGINPYRYAPQSEELSHLRDASIYPYINHKEVPTVYPPVSQMVFVALQKLGGGIYGFKVGFMSLNLLTMAVLFLILRALQMNPVRLLIYAWNPLVLMEFSHSGHSDIIGIFLMLLALLLIIRGKSIWSYIVLALSFLTKFLSLLFLPFFTLHRRQSRILPPLLFGAVTLLLYLPYSEVGLKLFAGLGVYSDKWAFNSSVFAVINTGIRHLLELCRSTGAMSTLLGPFVNDANASLKLAKLAIGLIFGCSYVYYMLRLQRDLDREGEIWFFKLGFVLFGMFIILNPTVHPWYLTWMVPFLVIYPNRAWILFTGLAGLSYWVLNDYWDAGVWHEAHWVRAVEYLPFFALLFFDAAQKRAEMLRLPRPG